MNAERLEHIGKWLNKSGYNIDLTDPKWMEGYVIDHEWRDIIQLMSEFSISERMHNETT